MVAMDGASDMSLERALEVWPLARFSRNRPSVTKVISMVQVSKSVPGRLCGGIKSETSMAAQLKTKAQVVPRTTRTSMVGDRCLTDLNAET